jgi:hypothetical protein
MDQPFPCPGNDGETVATRRAATVPGGASDLEGEEPAMLDVIACPDLLAVPDQRGAERR